MKSKAIFIAAALLVMLMAGAGHAKSDGSLGTDCASCHANGIPGGKPNTPPADPPADPPTDPPPADPPSTPPTDPPPTDLPSTPPTDPPPTDMPGTPPADGGTEQPGEPAAEPPAYVASDHILSLELGTVWHYGSLGTADDLQYVFYAAVETDTSVNLVDVITPNGNRLQITSEPGTEVDNVKTWFGEVDGVRVWECEATFVDAGELKDYDKGDYTVEVHHDGGVAEARVKYGGTKPIWGIGASVGGVKQDQPSTGADKNSGGQKPDKIKPNKNVTANDKPSADVRKNDGQNKKAKGKSNKKSHKPKKPKDNDDDDEDDDD